MTELILHHYPTSPFSEKIRSALGFKRASWRAVTIPMIMPKPELMPLTGGYRRTPVLQIGADIWCDSQIILREVDRHHPKPPIFPTAHEGVAAALAYWADRSVFWSAVGVVMGEIGDKLPAAFHKDRAEFSGRPADPARIKAMQPMARDQLQAQLAWPERMLADGRSFLLGATPSAADYALYNPVWFVRSRLGAQAAPLDRYPLLARWAERMQAGDNGTATDMTAEEALDIARVATPLPTAGIAEGQAGGWRNGQKVAVTPDDTGKVPVIGELATLNVEEIAIRRNDPRVGEIVVHFPRAGFVITAG